MPEIAVGDVYIPENRQRRDFKPSKIQELAESIEDKGLLHPIVLREVDGQFILVAGERRLRAIQFLGWERISYTLFEALDELHAREAELEENVCRVDLSWQEKTDALAALHKLRKEQNPDQTYRDTAREITDDEEKVKPKGVEIAEAAFLSNFANDPEVQGARSAKEAFRIATRKTRTQFAQAFEEAQKREQAARGESKEKISPHTLIHGSLHEHMTLLPGDFSCIIADPPYGRGADQFGDAARGQHIYADDEETAKAIMSTILNVGYRVTTDDAHLYMFFDIDHWLWLLAAARDLGWTPFQSPLVWHKGSMGHAPWGPGFWRKTYELIFFATKPKKRELISTVQDTISDCPAEKEKDYAAQKPVSLYQKLIKLSCNPGDKVLDPCCGSGPIFPAAQATSTIATGIEINKDAHSLAYERWAATRI